MPFRSMRQNRWAHTAAGTKALGGPAKVKEWERATDYKHLPEIKSKKKKKKRHGHDDYPGGDY